MLSKYIPHPRGIELPGKQSGAALLLTILVLLGISLGMVSSQTQHTYMQVQQLYLQQQRAQRQFDVEGLFSSLADNAATAPFLSSQGELALEGDIEMLACPYAVETDSLCYQVRVTDQQNRLIRQRILVVPESCAPAYWFAPMFRSYYFDLSTGGPEAEPITPAPPKLKG